MADNSIPFSAETYTQRRKHLMKSLGSGKILLLGNKEASINFDDNHYAFRQDSSFLYYIGINLPDLCAILDCDTGQTTLIGDDVSIDMIIWMGNQPSLSSLANQVGIENLSSINSLSSLVDSNTCYLPPYRGEQELVLRKLFSISETSKHKELIQAVIRQRNIKSEEEVKELDHAVTLTAQMHRAVLTQAKPGMHEYEMVSIANTFAWQHNARWSFPPILTKNGQTLHNHFYGNKTQDGDLVLYDGGIETGSGYCGDMTRTFPINGKFSSQQANIYNVVYAAYETAVEQSQPGKAYKEIHLAASRKIIEGLKEINLMKGDVDAALEAGAHALFFPHGLGHMMGLDVHDMENLGEDLVGYDDTIQRSAQFGLKSLRLGRNLEKGNVITIEPGVYLIPELIDKFQNEGKFTDFVNYSGLAHYRNLGGVRIEDDYLITENGNRRLGDPLENDIQSIEHLRSLAL